MRHIPLKLALSNCPTLSDGASITSSTITHQILPFIIDLRVINRITNPLQERRLASVCTPDYENTEMSIFLLNLGLG